ncbi:GNAT family N-acetyltransferase [Caldisphaera sp.]|uniref:GNAT family N-acetyltransferase n=1 Tax=Caldisphaera sp. TaxID=2060322 RepID=UPI003D09E873
MIQDIKFEKVIYSDKKLVEELTKNTFEWGDYIKEVFDEWINDGLFIKAVDSNGNILGIIHVKICDDFAWLEGIRVNKNFRKKGIGKKLTEKAIELSNKRVFRLTVNEKNEPSLALVKSMGFKEIDRFYFNSGNRLDFKNIIEMYKLEQKKNIDFIFNGYVDNWVWYPFNKYKKLFYKNDQIILLQTNPPFALKGDNLKFEHISINKKENSEGFIVFELKI